MELTKEQRPMLREALIHAFPNKDALRIMLRDQLDMRLDHIVGGDNLTVIVDKLIEWAESQGRLAELVLGAVKQNPGNTKIQEFLKNVDIKLLWKTAKGDIPISDIELENFISKLEKIKHFYSGLEILESLPMWSKAYNIEELKVPNHQRKTKIVLLLEILYKNYPNDKESQEQLILNFNKKLLLESFKFEVVTLNAQGQITKREQRQAQYYDQDLGNGIILEMVAIPGGKFLMGSPEGEGYDDERPQHEVTVQPFFMGKYPVTQAQWRTVAALPRIDRDLNRDPSRFKGDNLPVEQVSWYDVVEFCARLSKASGKNYRLPSEAEWEYACRAGTVTPFHFGETLTSELANYRGSSIYREEAEGEYREKTTPVGSFPGNAFGLFDMHGNVWEWCADWWNDNYEGAPINGSPWLANENDNQRLLRGGSWNGNPQYCRSAFRGRLAPDLGNGNIGFRVVCVPPSTIL